MKDSNGQQIDSIEDMTMDEVRMFATLCLNFLADKNQLLGTELFNSMCRHTVGISVECVLFRINEINETEIYLIKRRENEAYAGQWHCPGTFLRNGEDDELGIKRLVRKELFAGLESFLFCEYKFLDEERFEKYLALIYLIKIEGEPINKNGEWFNLKDVKDLFIVDHHVDTIIPIALNKAIMADWI